MARSLEDGPVFIRSADNPELAFTVAANPPIACSPVTLQTVDPASGDAWNTPFSQWVLHKITDGMYQISLFASGGTMFLQSASAAVGAPIEIGTPSTESTQFWKVDTEASGDQYLTNGAPGFEVGFVGDIPVNGSPLTLVPAHDAHDLGDRFTVSAAP